MKIVVIESPFRPSEEEILKYAGRYSPAELLRQNLIYARSALLNALSRGETPLASHLLYTQVWSERAELREAGIKAGLEMYHRVDAAAHYIDLGRSSGMRRAERHAELLGIEWAPRTIIDTCDSRDPREYLARQDLVDFPYLEELRNAERTDARAARRVTR